MGLSMASDYSNPDNTRKRTLKTNIFKNFSLREGGGNRGPGSKPTASRTLHAWLPPLFSWISLFLALFWKRSIKHCCIILPYFSRFPSLLELPPHAFSEKTIIGQTKVCLHTPIFPVFFTLFSWAPNSLSYPTFREDKRANTLARKTTSLSLAHCKVLILSVRTCNFQNRCKTKKTKKW